MNQAGKGLSQHLLREIVDAGNVVGVSHFEVGASVGAPDGAGSCVKGLGRLHGAPEGAEPLASVVVVIFNLRHPRAFPAGVPRYTSPCVQSESRWRAALP